MKQALLGVVQFFGFLLFLPIIIAATVGFQTQVLGLPVNKEQWFLWGVVAFIVLYLFLYNCKEIYDFGSSVVAKLLKFFEPLAAFGPLVIPIYTVLIVCLYLILNVADVSRKFEGALLLALGFSVTMHLVLTAQQLYESDGGPIKGQYLLSFGFIGVLILILSALLLGCVIPELSFIEFIQFSYAHAVEMYTKIYQALF